MFEYDSITGQLRKSRDVVDFISRSERVRMYEYVNMKRCGLSQYKTDQLTVNFTDEVPEQQ